MAPKASSWSPSTSRSFFATPARMVCADCSADCARGGGRHAACLPDPGRRHARRRRRHADVLVPQLVAEGERQRVQRRLGGGIHRLLRHGRECDAGDDVDDLPAALLAHDRQDGADTVERPVEVQREGLLPVPVGQFFEVPSKAGARIVEQDIDASAELGGIADHGLDFDFLGDVAMEPERPAGIGCVQPRRFPFEVLVVDVDEDDHFRPVGEHRLRKGQPDPGRRPCHDGDLVSVVFACRAHRRRFASIRFLSSRRPSRGTRAAPRPDCPNG